MFKDDIFYELEFVSYLLFI